VDDDNIVRQSLEQALTLENFCVVTAANRQEALHGFGANRIDIVLLDLHLGRESGWDTLAQLRRIQPLLPVIIMTGHHGQRIPKTTRVDAFMEKPLHLPTLFLKLNELGCPAPTAQIEAGN
jgi:DNA-binding NtrC family response regulator